MENITKSELKIMNIVWERDNITSFDIINNINENWKVSTTRTFIKRLLNKGVLKIINKNGKVYTYTYTLTKEEYQKWFVKNAIETVFDGDINKIKQMIGD